MKTVTQKAAATDENRPWMEVVTQQVTSLRFGVVQIMVHDSKVVQIERTEKYESPKLHPAKANTDQKSGGNPTDSPC